MIKGAEAVIESYDTEYGTEPRMTFEMVGFEYQISKAEDGSNVHTITSYKAKNIKGHIAPARK